MFRDQMIQDRRLPARVAFAYFLTMTAVTRLRVAKSNPIPDGHHPGIFR
jgi:hypothetical protein